MDSAVRFSSCSSARPSTQRLHSACAASQERCQVPGATGQERRWQVPTWQVPRGFTEQHAPQNGSTEKDLTENGQFSSKVKSAKIHPRSSRNRNRPQTREETEKVVKGLTLRMAKARCDSSTWRNGWAPCRKPVHVLPGGAAECAKPPPPRRHSHAGTRAWGLSVPQQWPAGGCSGHLHACAWLAAVYTTGQPLTELPSGFPQRGGVRWVGVRKIRVLTSRHPVDLATRAPQGLPRAPTLGRGPPPASPD